MECGEVFPGWIPLKDLLSLSLPLRRKRHLRVPGDVDQRLPDGGAVGLLGGGGGPIGMGDFQDHIPRSHILAGERARPIDGVHDRASILDAQPHPPAIGQRAGAVAVGEWPEHHQCIGATGGEPAAVLGNR